MWSALDLRLVDAVDRAGRRMPPVIDHAVRYRVGHDRVAEVAASRLPADVVRTVHRRIGMSLAERGAYRLFDAARHLALAGVDEGGVDTDRFADVQPRAARRLGCWRRTRWRWTATGRAFGCSATDAGPTMPG